MQILRIYGHSDDCVEIDFLEGDVEFKAEFYYIDGETNVLLLSNGSVLRVLYNDDGEWEIGVACVPQETITQVHGFDALVDDTNDYSQVVDLSFNDGDEVRWAGLVENSRFQHNLR